MLFTKKNPLKNYLFLILKRTSLEKSEFILKKYQYWILCINENKQRAYIYKSFKEYIQIK